mgnify:FL=1
MKRMVRWVSVSFCKLCGTFINSEGLCEACAAKLGNDDTEGFGG